jgi:hypothetical protein
MLCGDVTGVPVCTVVVAGIVIIDLTTGPLAQLVMRADGKKGKAGP